MIRDVESQMKPYVYGMLEFFTMKYLGKSKWIEYDKNKLFTGSSGDCPFWKLC